MRLATFCVCFAVAHIALMSLPALAQQAPATTGAPPGPPATVAPPPYVPSTVGVAPPVSHPPIPVPSPEQEVPLAPVKTAPCSVSARETDGTTTCIGIPSERARAKRMR
jgi:hypothetical protein